jgi:Argininosuccinate lyase
MCTGGASGGVGQVRAGLAALAAADVPGLPDEQVRSEVLDLLACLNQLTGVLLDRIAAFDRRHLSHADAQRASSTWLVDFGRMSKGAALRWLSVARCLDRLPALAAGARAGTVSMEQLVKVAELARHIGIDQVRDYDEILAQLSAAAGPVEVSRACERIQALVDPDGAEPDPEEDFQRREITFSQLGSMLYIRGRLDPEGAAALQAAVDALMRPPRPGDERTAAQRRADAMVDLARGALAGTGLPEVGGERPQIGLLVTPEILFGPTGQSADGDPDPSAPGAHGPTSSGAPEAGTSRAVDEASSGCPATSSVDTTGSPPDGRSEPTPAGCPHGTDACGCHGDPLTRAGVPPLPERPWLTWVGEVSPELARRLACDGTIWRLVLDPRTGLPLDVGRKVRIVPWWMRKAIRARDRTCRWPGCDVPSEWTDAHHLIPWWRGGPTTAEQIVSLCRYHHTRVHEGQWTLRMDYATGEVWVWRPDGSPYELGPSRPWISPSRQGPRSTAPPSRPT